MRAPFCTPIVRLCGVLSHASTGRRSLTRHKNMRMRPSTVTVDLRQADRKGMPSIAGRNWTAGTCPTQHAAQEAVCSLTWMSLPALAAPTHAGTGPVGQLPRPVKRRSGLLPVLHRIAPILSPPGICCGSPAAVPPSAMAPPKAASPSACSPSSLQPPLLEAREWPGTAPLTGVRCSLTGDSFAAVASAWMVIATLLLAPAAEALGFCRQQRTPCQTCRNQYR